jgi:hypothetical protein
VSNNKKGNRAFSVLFSRGSRISRSLQLHGYGLAGPNLQTPHLARLALDDNLERTAADFAVGREVLRGDGGVDDQVTALTAKRAHDLFGEFH